MTQQITKWAMIIFCTFSTIFLAKAQEMKPYQDELMSVNAGVIRDSFEIRLINRWKDCLVTANNNPEKNAFWVADDFKKYKYPYRDIYGISSKGGNEYFYKPTVLEILDTEIRYTYIVKTAFVGDDKTIKSIYNVLAQRDSPRTSPVFFKSITDYNTRSWQKMSVGNVNYIVHSTHTFDTVQAKKMDDFSTHFADYFNTKPIQIKYYLCKGVKELYQIQGYDYLPIMYYSATDKGGITRAEDATIYAGIDAELYEHEAVHIYTYQKFQQNIHPFLDEGIATYLGGSNGKFYALVRQNLKAYLNEKPKIDFLSFIPNDIFKQQGFSDANFSLPYAVSAVLCEIVIRKGGKDLLFQLLNQGNTEEDFWRCMKNLDITKENLLEKLMEELEKEPILPQ